MVAPSVATDHFAQFPAGDSGGSGDVDYIFFWRKKASPVRLRDWVLVFRCDGVSAMVWCLFVFMFVCCSAAV